MMSLPAFEAHSSTSKHTLRLRCHGPQEAWSLDRCSVETHTCFRDEADSIVNATTRAPHFHGASPHPSKKNSVKNQPL